MSLASIGEALKPFIELAKVAAETATVAINAKKLDEVDIPAEHRRSLAQNSSRAAINGTRILTGADE